MSILPIRLGALPIIDTYIDKLGISDVFARMIPSDTRDKVPVWKTLCIALRNIIVERYPLYKMGDWAKQRGLINDDEIALYNDDRIGRGLDRLYRSDRTAITTEIVLRAIKKFELKINRIHNDSTTITLHGNYDDYNDCGAALPKHGHNKDFRPDLKQLVFSLSITSDFSVPLLFKVFDGNRTDDTTHIENWMHLRGLIGSSDFTYVADSKLCVRDTLQYIATEGGTFITILPETRKENSLFYEWIQTNNPEWVTAIDEQNPRKKDGIRRTYWTFDSPLLTSEGYRIVWVKSLQKQNDDGLRRLRRIEHTENGFTALKKKRFLNKEKLQSEVNTILNTNKSNQYFNYEIVPIVQEHVKQTTRGRPTTSTLHHVVRETTYTIEYSQNASSIQSEARTDGLFPIVTNSKDQAAQVLIMYKYQPMLEKRHEQLKSVYDVAPVLLQNPQRIESLLLLYFIGMVITSLIERDMKLKMEEKNLDSVPLYPENRKCKSPTAGLIVEIFNDVRLQYITKEDRIIEVIPDELTIKQKLVLDFLDIKSSKFFGSG